MVMIVHLGGNGSQHGHLWLWLRHSSPPVWEAISI
jgi:hypothetical protein